MRRRPLVALAGVLVVGGALLVAARLGGGPAAARAGRAASKAVLGDGAVVQDRPAAEPRGEELERLVTRTMLDLDAAVRARDFRPFHAKVSSVWRKQATSEDLQRIFQEFIDRRIDLRALERVRPVFDAPPVGVRQGVLLVRGSYPTEPSRVTFRLGYLWEPPEWRLFSTEVDVK